MPDIVYIEEAIRVHALHNAYLANLLSDGDERYRWYGPVMEQAEALPAVTVQLISSTDAAPTQIGHSSLERARYQFMVWGSCWRDCLQVERAIVTPGFFHGFRGNLGGIEVQRCAKVNVLDLGKEPGRNVYKRAIDFYFLYRVS